ncbi:MAG: 30S ribosomal protein S8 [Legionellaceae bacterium]|nr:30S ribosomal protein S8 [Legionellaceae bacterium]HAF88051.1 30S ribosomal protein S8 [Legionellales bacterium]|tara:strand:- start:191 stop:586 length:396 start_codon:yes stop_codon:yes gene_type:complete
MSMHDPIADMLTRIRNGQMANHRSVTLNSSKLKEEIVRVLKEEGYIVDYSTETHANNSKSMTIELKYFQNQPVIKRIIRISRPGLRVYESVKKLRRVPGFGIKILSTTKGVMTHACAKSTGVGGEVLCEIA